MRKYIVGNWKMNGTSAELAEIEAISAMAKSYAPAVDSALCLPATLISRAATQLPAFLDRRSGLPFPYERSAYRMCLGHDVSRRRRDFDTCRT